MSAGANRSTDLAGMKRVLWRAGQTLLALDAADRRKASESERRFLYDTRKDQPAEGHVD
jgi:uncharacterized protein YifE (UPF0438 family)